MSETSPFKVGETYRMRGADGDTFTVLRIAPSGNLIGYTAGPGGVEKPSGRYPDGRFYSDSDSLADLILPEPEPEATVEMLAAFYDGRGGGWCVGQPLDETDRNILAALTAALRVYEAQRRERQP